MRNWLTHKINLWKCKLGYHRWAVITIKDEASSETHKLCQTCGTKE